MKSSIQTYTTQKEKPFPKLMKSKVTGHVVLFSGPGNGVVVYAEPDPPAYPYWYHVGDRAEGLWMSLFEDFDGVVCLEND